MEASEPCRDQQRATGEVSWFLELLGLTMSPQPEGQEADCPIRRGATDQHALTLDLTGLDVLACHDRGAVLTA
jgi:hypothetical protein